MALYAACAENGALAAATHTVNQVVITAALVNCSLRLQWHQPESSCQPQRSSSLHDLQRHLVHQQQPRQQRSLLYVGRWFCW
jgi:hypothetical protein